MFEDLDKAIREAFDEDNETIAALRLRCEEVEKRAKWKHVHDESLEHELQDQVADLTEKLAAMTQERDRQLKAKDSFMEAVESMRTERTSLQRQLATAQEENVRLMAVYNMAHVITHSTDVVLLVTESTINIATMEEAPTRVTQDYVNELWNQLVDAVNGADPTFTTQKPRCPTK